jgi:hypothetical protein
VHPLGLMFSALIALSASACSITKDVKPVPYKVTTLCIERNNDTLMDDYHGVVEKDVMGFGIHTRSIWPNEEKSCEQILKYHAEWTWDLAMHLSQATFSLDKGEEMVGYAKYEPRRFSFNLDKFGTTDDKIQPVMRELFKNQ